MEEIEQLLESRDFLMETMANLEKKIVALEKEIAQKACKFKVGDYVWDGKQRLVVVDIRFALNPQYSLPKVAKIRSDGQPFRDSYYPWRPIRPFKGKVNEKRDSSGNQWKS